jgi:hypothetical protein
MRSAFKDLLAFLLGHAAEYAEFLPLCLQLFEIGEAMKDLLLGFVTDRAGVVKDKVCLLDALYLR